MTKIMVVDDEADITFIIKETLTREGYDVIVANSGKDALEKIRDAAPDLVLLDVMMPDLDGWETCKQIKADEDMKDTIVTMLTVKSEDEDKVKSFDYALADWHINKPIDRKKLVKTVKWLLTKPIKRA
ncbi:MAG: response regulator transcription factor [Candidatus Hydrothermarchaeales archaeon]